jgi:hypothetical protein
VKWPRSATGEKTTEASANHEIEQPPEAFGDASGGLFVLSFQTCLLNARVTRIVRDRTFLRAEAGLPRLRPVRPVHGDGWSELAN